MSNEAAKTTSNNPFDIFIVGLKKGLNIGLYSLLPNVVMAFVLTTQHDADAPVGIFSLQP